MLQLSPTCHDGSFCDYFRKCPQVRIHLRQLLQNKSGGDGELHIKLRYQDSAILSFLKPHICGLAIQMELRMSYYCILIFQLGNGSRLGNMGLLTHSQVFVRFDSV
jgi:hypothetical protein